MRARADLRLTPADRRFALPMSDAAVRRAGRLACAATSCLLLVPAGLILLLLGVVASMPNSDTGEAAPTALAALFAVAGSAVIVSCLPVCFLFARGHRGAGVGLTTVGLGLSGFVATWCLS